MTDTNGNVAADHLYTYQGIPIARAIYPDLAAAATEFRSSGYTFSIALPAGGYRSLAVQVDMRAHPWPDPKYGLSKSPPSPALAPVGQSRHGFAKAVDVISTAPAATRTAIMARHHFVLWTASDNNHYEWGNVLTPDGLATAGGGTSPLQGRFFDMAQLELIRENEQQATVWYCVDRLWRYGVPDETSLADYVYMITRQAAAGNPVANPVVQVGVKIGSFGAIVNQAGTPTPAVFDQATIDKIAAATEARLQDEFAAEKAALAAAEASINANINDQPTTFEITPKA